MHVATSSAFKENAHRALADAGLQRALARSGPSFVARRTAAVAILLTFGLIVLGAWVRATGSGLACPDWPTCYGHWLPLEAPEALSKYIDAFFSPERA